MSRERTSWIDALRGFSMLGIRIVNLPSMNTLSGEEAIKYGFMKTTADYAVGQLSMIFLNGKMYPIFAFLFGLGTYIFMKSVEQRGLNPYKYITKRLGILFILGSLHIFFVWWGDILFVYSVLGMILITFYLVRPGRIILASLLLLMGVPVLSTVTHLLGLYPIFSAPAFHNVIEPSTAHAVYAQGSFLSITHQRATDWAHWCLPFLRDKTTVESYLASGEYYCQLLGLFLLGFWIGKIRLYQSVGNHLSELKKVFKFCLILSVLTTGILGLGRSVHLLNGSALAICYICIFLFSYQLKIGRAILDVFVPVGKMSLTAYFAHTVTFSLLLYGYGLGLYGQVGPAFLFLVSLIFYACVACFCHLWLKTFSQGPMEWVWRLLVYGRSSDLISKEVHVIN